MNILLVKLETALLNSSWLGLCFCNHSFKVSDLNVPVTPVSATCTQKSWKLKKCVKQKLNILKHSLLIKKFNKNFIKDKNDRFSH